MRRRGYCLAAAFALTKHSPESEVVPIVTLVPGLATGLLVVACVAAAVVDIRDRRLPNWLTLGAILVAIALRLPGGWAAVASGLASATLAFALGFGCYLVGGLGGGDVKLMAGLAAFLDPRHLVPALLVMAFTGGVMALIAAARKRALGRVLRNVATILLTFVTFGRYAFSGWREGGGASLPEPADPHAVSNPYGVAIAAGALAGWFLR